jgi:hypothetical protein
MKDPVKKGWRVKFVKLLSEEPEDWDLDELGFGVLKAQLLSKGTITEVHKHYVNLKERDYFIDVRFDNGYEIDRANYLGFEVLKAKVIEFKKPQERKK